MSKVCPRCEQEKPIDAFGLTRRKCANGFKPVRFSYCKACRVKDQTARDKANPERLKLSRRRIKLRKNYGITPEQHAAQVATQGGCCAICARPLDDLSPQTVHVDHDHETGALRGILCGPCNTGLGSFRDNEQNLLAAVRYLRTNGVWRAQLEAVA